MSSELMPGWYVRKDMCDTMCFWDGDGWTDKTAPTYQGQTVRTSVTELAIGVALGTVLGAFLAGWLLGLLGLLGG